MSNEKAKIIVLANQKGGAGKTSAIVNLASASVFCGKANVCVLDLDPQRSISYWQEKLRKEPEKRYDYLFPQVVAIEPNTKPSTVIELLQGSFREIWVDTAGFLGFNDDVAQQYLEDVLPYADIIVTPLRSGPFDVTSTEQTIEYLDDVLSNIGCDDIPRLLLRSDIRGGDKGLDFLIAQLEPILEQHPKWKCIDSYIPSSTAFYKAMGRGCNAFVPKKIERVAEAAITVYKEIQVALGEESEMEARKLLAKTIKNLASIRQSATKAKRDDDLKAQDDDLNDQNDDSDE